MGLWDIEPLPERAGYVTVEILDGFEKNLPGEVIYMRTADYARLMADNIKKNKLELIDKLKPADQVDTGVSKDPLVKNKK